MRIIPSRMMWLVRLACPLLDPARRVRTGRKCHRIVESQPVPRKPNRRSDDEPERESRKRASPLRIAQQVHPAFPATMHCERNHQRSRYPVRRAREPSVVARQHSQKQEKSGSHQRLPRSVISPISQPKHEVREIHRCPNKEHQVQRLGHRRRLQVDQIRISRQRQRREPRSHSRLPLPSKPALQTTTHQTKHAQHAGHIRDHRRNRAAHSRSPHPRERHQRQHHDVWQRKPHRSQLQQTRRTRVNRAPRDVHMRDRIAIQKQ